MSAKAPIVFSHGNGFPAGTYRRLFEHWRAAGHAVHAVEKFGHDPAYPVTSNWPHLRDELIAYAERSVGGPCAFVGHSLGGYLSLLAAIRRPDLALGVVLLDAPVIAGWRARVLQVGKLTGLAARLSPGAVSRRRRAHWPSAGAAHEHFASKPAFATWHPQVLADYVAAGTAATGSERRLAFDREVETAIYATLPHHLPRLLRRRPPACPVAFVGGTRSAELRKVGLAATQRLTAGRVSWIEGSHRFPMERPDETAAAVLAALGAFGPAGPSAGSGTTGRRSG